MLSMITNFFRILTHLWKINGVLRLVKKNHDCGWGRRRLFLLQFVVRVSWSVILLIDKYSACPSWIKVRWYVVCFKWSHTSNGQKSWRFSKGFLRALLSLKKYIKHVLLLFEENINEEKYSIFAFRPLISIW